MKNLLLPLCTFFLLFSTTISDFTFRKSVKNNEKSLMQQCFTSNGPFGVTNITIIERPFVESPSHHRKDKHVELLDKIDYSITNLKLNEHEENMALIWDYLEIWRYLTNSNSSFSSYNYNQLSTPLGVSLGMFWDPSEDFKVSCQRRMFLTTGADSALNAASESDQYTCSVKVKSLKSTINIPSSLVHILSLSNNQTSKIDALTDKDFQPSYTYQPSQANESLWCVSIPKISKLYNINFQTNPQRLTVSDVVSFYSALSMMALVLLSTVALFIIKDNLVRQIICGFTMLSVLKNFSMLCTSLMPSSALVIGVFTSIVVFFMGRYFLFSLVYPNVLIEPSLSTIDTHAVGLESLKVRTYILLSTSAIISFLSASYSLTSPFTYYSLGLSTSITNNPIIVCITLSFIVMVFSSVWTSERSLKLYFSEGMVLSSIKQQSYHLGVLCILVYLYPSIQTSFIPTWCVITWMRDVEAVVSGYIHSDKLMIMGLYLTDLSYAITILALIGNWMIFGSKRNTVNGYSAVNIEMKNVNIVDMDILEPEPLDISVVKNSIEEDTDVVN